MYQGTAVIHATFAIHQDPRYFPEPEVFRPERWLDEEGKYCARREGFLAFGTGKIY